MKASELDGALGAVRSKTWLECVLGRKRLAHTKDVEFPVICQPRKASERIGVKFYCYICKRYVLPNDEHQAL